MFVNHITTLNADKFPDGKPGSIRRCFCKQNETGMQWDELITVNIPDKKRQLIIFNLVNFPCYSTQFGNRTIVRQLKRKQMQVNVYCIF